MWEAVEEAFGKRPGAGGRGRASERGDNTTRGVSSAVKVPL